MEKQDFDKAMENDASLSLEKLKDESNRIYITLNQLRFTLAQMESRISELEKSIKTLNSKIERARSYPIHNVYLYEI